MMNPLYISPDGYLISMKLSKRQGKLIIAALPCDFETLQADNGILTSERMQTIFRHKNKNVLMS